MIPRLFGLGLLMLLLPSGFARAHNPVEVHAVIIGVNQAAKAGQQPLHYADDDAISFHRLFASLGQAHLLTQPDANTARLHPQLVARAPTYKNVMSAVSDAIRAVNRAVDRGQRAELVFIYSGHGDVDAEGGYLALAKGARFSSADLESLLKRSRATTNHVIVDACKSYFLVHEKGVGGQRGPARRGFHRSRSLARRFPNTGFLLSTSSAASSHEWARYQAGIFSHEVRSALSGAADVNGDGAVSYAETAAFVTVANTKIPNERFRPTLHATPPLGKPTHPIVRWKAGKGMRRMLVPGHLAGRFYLEDRRGVRLADFHSARGVAVNLWVRIGEQLYLHDLSRRLEYTIDTGSQARPLSRGTARPISYREKGAAHEAFESIFGSPFGPDTYHPIATAMRLSASQTKTGSTGVPKSKRSSLHRNELSAGYRLQSSYVAEGTPFHGAALAYRRRFLSGLWAAVGLSYGFSRYRRTDSIAVAMHEAQFFGSLAWEALRWGRVHVELGGLLGGGLAVQRSVLTNGANLQANQWLLRYRGQIIAVLEITPSVSVALSGNIGHDLANQRGGIGAELAGGGTLMGRLGF